MIACYLELYEEGEVEHINGSFPNTTALGRTKKSTLGYARHHTLRMRTHLHEYRTRYRIFDLR